MTEAHAASNTGTGTTEGASLLDRIREALAAESPTREVRMFGGISFMVRNKMVVAARGDSDLLVRVDPTRSSELLARPGASQAEMGTGRDMGPSWISVSSDALTTDEQLSYWIDVAMEYNRAQSTR